ncbi:hypothetical protein FGKAn22_03840 [Ferrigenium kumadai]|uniref:Uncharacterized protein n=1 Tax=Ferrigenium kumadai TaxID=1682490 RepID=A0AAN1VZN5_9PROT|nr:hypothetical protein [Ferrigenium kumadai]BBI98691.1 hypothetical protein FGKAn22_03840 [Ferrigenium kumadai]
MIKSRMLNADGIATFTKWLENPSGSQPPAPLLDSEEMTEPFGDFDIDPSREFVSRQEFGEYLNEQFSGANFNELMSPDSDGFWAWVAIAYFRQLTAKGIRRAEHYVVIRKGSAGSLAYRHAVRTPYELVHIHGAFAEICLKSPMATFGDMTEQLASRQGIAHNRGFFQTAHELYIKGGVLKRGASSKPKKLKDRKPGDRTGLGSVRRLAIALQRLDLTYDTEDMDSRQMCDVLPKEFSMWQKFA